MAPETFQIAVPLSEFPWTGTRFDGFKCMSLTTARPALGDLEDQLAPSEKTELFFASHWLTFAADKSRAFARDTAELKFR